VSEPFICQIHWTYPFLEAIPWLLLFAVAAWERRKQHNNRWVLLAAAMGFIIIWMMQKYLTFLPPSLTDVFTPVFQALLYGFCMTCLASSYLTSPQRGAAFLKRLLALAIASSIALFCMIDYQEDRVFIPSFLSLLVIGSGLLLSWVIASTVCRFYPRVMLFNIVFIATYFVLIISTIIVLMLASSSNPPWTQILQLALGLVAAATVIFQPLILVLWLHPSQKARLTEMLQ